ncbi:hypothetical protein BC941DRAFT_359436 [Chlamydoabsidia padenii]|nr:hypothetical protein BC941DRAFT_359436 [Chlamydoabsidia padenii]
MAKRLYEIRRTAAFAWSPDQQTPLIATGTIAGALDDSFSNESELELFQLDLTSSKTYEANHSQHGLSPVAKVNSSTRFNTLTWGYTSTEKPYGIIAGGMENGELTLWDPVSILTNKGEDASLLLQNHTHTGTIRGLDFNVFQSNLLASAGSNSEVYIWDLAKPDKPYTPGSRSMNMDDITSVGWNGQVSHILATSSTSGHTVVWDLRNRKEVMTLAYSGQSGGGISAGNRRGITTLAWHPDVATQLVTGAEDDNNPIITLWDLRHAHSPEKTLAGHQKGILGVSWCRQDSDLLLSCGKDSRTLSWNPQSGELLGQVSQNSNWTFQADWCPRNPDLFASASFDGQINVFSLQGSNDDHTTQTPPKLMQSNDPFEAAMLSAVPQTPSFKLKQPPKWLRRPAGASFGFGGKLVYFNNKAGQAAAQLASTLPPGSTPAPQTIARQITITNVVTEPEIVKQADELEVAMEHKNLQQLVDDRQAQSSSNQNVDEMENWKLLKTLYGEDVRGQLLAHLGFNKDDIITATNNLTAAKTTANNVSPPTANGFDTAPTMVSTGNKNNKEGGVSGLFGGDATDNNDFFVNPVGQLSLNDIPSAVYPPRVNQQPLELYPSSSSDVDRLVTRAIVLGDFESAVNVCLATEKWSDALMLSICGGQELLDRTRQAYLQHHSSSQPYLRLLENVVNGDLESVVCYTDLKEWDSVLAVLCTFAEEKDFKSLCKLMGARLQDAWAESNDENKRREFRRQATVCYLASADLETVTGIWIVEQEEQEQSEDDRSRGTSLQRLVEKVTIFRNATGFVDSYLADTSGRYPLGGLYDKYCQYADLLATQGKLSTALKYLSLTPSNYQAKSSVDNLPIIRDRVYRACGALHGTSAYPEPVFPFDMTPLISDLDLIAATAPTTIANQQQQYGVNSNSSFNQSYAPTQQSTMAPHQQTTTYTPVTNPMGVMYQQQQQHVTQNPYSVPQQSNYGGVNYNQQSMNQPSTDYHNYGYNNSFTNAYQPSLQQQQQQPVSAPLPPPPMAGPPRQSTNIASPSRAGTPVNLKNTTGAWNDPPMLANPNVTKSPRTTGNAAITNRVTSPFPNMPASAAFMPPPPQQQQYMQSGPPGSMGPPQQQTAPLIRPPPMNAMAPTPMAKQFPPQQQGQYSPSIQQRGPSQGPPPAVNNTYAPSPYMQQQLVRQSPQQYQQQPMPFQQGPPFNQDHPPPPGSPSPAPPKPTAPVVPEKSRHRKYE